MRIQILNFKILFIFFVCSFSAQHVLAENNFASSSSNQRISEDVFLRYEIQKVITRLCRDLQINSKNKTAQQNFSKIAQHPNLTARQRSQVYLLEDLLKYNKDLKRRANYWTSKRNILKDRFIEYGYNSQTFIEGLRDIEGHMSQATGARTYYHHSLFDQTDPLLLMYQILNDEKDQLLAQVEYLQEQYHWLKRINKDQRQYSSFPKIARPSNIVIPVVSDNVIYVESEFLQEIANEAVYVYPEVISMIPKKEENLFDLKEKPDFSKEQFNELQENLKQKDDKINALSKQVVNLSLKMSEIETLLNKRIESIEFLKAELDDTMQRFMLEKRIIQEKDREIQSLQISYDQLKTRSHSNENVSYSRDEKLIELSGILEIYKYKLGEKNHLAKEKTKALVKTQDDLRFLKNQLTFLESELSKIKTQSHDNEFKDPEIEIKVWELQSKLEDIQHFVLENLNDSDKTKFHRQFKSSNLSN